MCERTLPSVARVSMIMVKKLPRMVRVPPCML